MRKSEDSYIKFLVDFITFCSTAPPIVIAIYYTLAFAPPLSKTKIIKPYNCKQRYFKIAEKYLVLSFNVKNKTFSYTVDDRVREIMKEVDRYYKIRYKSINGLRYVKDRRTRKELKKYVVRISLLKLLERVEKIPQ